MSLCKNFNIQPSEIDRMQFWEYEYYLEAVNENIKKEQDNQAEQDKKYGNMSPSSMMRQAGKSMPNTSNFKMPSAPRW